MLAIGREQFGELLAGFHAVDEHFRTAPFEAEHAGDLPGLLNVWYSNFFDAQTHAVLPYSQYLHRFPAYLQQLTMECNGKSVRWRRLAGHAPRPARSSGASRAPTASTPSTSCCTRAPGWSRRTSSASPSPTTMPSTANDMHDLFMSNFFAQTAALAFGKTAEEIAAEGTAADVVPHKVMPGNRPTSTILARKLTPSTLGQLVALYEHIVFVEGTIWGIDSFDQWGVELGKVMAQQLTPQLTRPEPPSAELDSSTRTLVSRYRAARGRAVD